MRHMKIYIPLFLILILFTSMPIVLGDLEEDSPIIVDGFAGVSKDTSNAEITETAAIKNDLVFICLSFLWKA